MILSSLYNKTIHASKSYCQIVNLTKINRLHVIQIIPGLNIFTNWFIHKYLEVFDEADGNTEYYEIWRLVCGTDRQMLSQNSSSDKSA